jgi:hypothetical protein
MVHKNVFGGDAGTQDIILHSVDLVVSLLAVVAAQQELRGDALPVQFNALVQAVLQHEVRRTVRLQTRSQNEDAIGVKLRSLFIRDQIAFRRRLHIRADGKRGCREDDQNQQKNHHDLFTAFFIASAVSHFTAIAAYL